MSLTSRPDRRSRRIWLRAATFAVAVEWAWVLGAQEAQQAGFSMYQIIQDRSPFRPLAGLEPEAPTTTIQPTPTVRIEWAEGLYLTGVSLIAGRSVAFLERLSGSAVEDTYMLGVGDARDGMRLVSIDPAVPSATVEQDGQSVMLTFDKEKPAGARGAAPPQERTGDTRRRPAPPQPPNPLSAPPASPDLVPRQVVPPAPEGGLPSLRSRRRTLN